MNHNNLEALKLIENSEYINKIAGEFREKDPLIDGKDQIRNLYYLSFIPSAIGVASAAFFVWYLVSDYPLWTKFALGAILMAVLIGNEVAKRSLLAISFKKTFLLSPIGGGLIVGLVIVHAISGISSYLGGEKGVIMTSTPPALVQNAKLPELQQRLAEINKSIAKQESTTWKGVITVDANRNLKKLYPTQQAIMSQISQIESEDQSKHKDQLSAHESKTMNFGIVLGIVALLCDAVLFLMYRSIYRIKSAMAKLARSGRKASPTLPENHQDPGTQQTPGEAAANFSAANVSNSLQGVSQLLDEADVSELLKLAKRGANANKGGYAKRNTEESQAKAARLERIEAALGEVLAN